jgi:hypothetical protein
MINSERNRRPNCDKILERKSEWGICSSDLLKNTSFKNIFEQYVEIKSLENSFIERFIRIKFKNFKDSTNSEMNSLNEPEVKPEISAKPKIDRNSGQVSELAKNFQKLMNNNK